MSFQIARTLMSALKSFKSDRTKTFPSKDNGFTLNAIWNDMFYGGLTFRTYDAVGIMAGLNWNSFTFGYSYDITVNRISSISTGSHELLVKYCYPLPPIPITKARRSEERRVGKGCRWWLVGA